jgi:membrane associated rhomboid family serine protease
MRVRLLVTGSVVVAGVAGALLVAHARGAGSPWVGALVGLAIGAVAAFLYFQIARARKEPSSEEGASRAKHDGEV